MLRSAPFPIGTPIVWRSRPMGEVGYVIAGRVLADDTDVAAIVQPAGAPLVRRLGQRGGPNGRSLLPGTWDGAREERTWPGPPMVRLHPVGRGNSVLRAWRPDERRFDGWYVNLEQPWCRTTIGFDSRDDVLDVVVSDDLREVGLKDEDELEFAVEVGVLTEDEALSIRGNGTRAINDVTQRRWPFEDDAWTPFRPATDDAPPALPTGWDDPGSA